jgi:tRNA modification GTPase
MSLTGHSNQETICAIATPKGVGGVGIVRISGPLVEKIALLIAGNVPKPRFAHYADFRDKEGELIDKGICLFFPAPNSFTGEDVLELQAHGGPIILDQLLQSAVAQGARLARPGEFSERAYLNDKLDLAQAEAIADLIESHSVEASRFALRSLQGEFSRLIDILLDEIIELRVFVEAAIDFPEEEIDFLQSGDVLNRLQSIQARLTDVLAQAKTGRILKEGLSLVIIGEPNVGKSSLLNLLSGQSTAIVTDIAGTTRDTLREMISLDGLPLNIIDTAGIRKSNDVVEVEGMKRAWHEVNQADHVLCLLDASNSSPFIESDLWKELQASGVALNKISLVMNKIDLSGDEARISRDAALDIPSLYISALHKKGFDLLTGYLKELAGYTDLSEGGFIARRRHLDALHRANTALNTAYEQLAQHKAGELLAEDLRAAQHALSEITGKFSSDDLLGEIFSSFCIGK